MKNWSIFVATCILEGRIFCLFAAGIFYALSLHIHGATPVSVLNGPTAFKVQVNGSVAPFFHATKQTLLSVMTCTEKKRLNGKTTSRSNRPAHDTSESIYSKFLIEKQAKNQAYGYILPQGLLRDYIAYSRGESCSLESVDERLEMVLKNF